LNAKKKIFNVSKNYQKIILSLFYRDVFLDNDSQIENPIKKILQTNCASLNLDLLEEDFHYLNLNQFEKEYSHNDILDLNKLDYLIFHYDEKWEIDNYIKAFKKASSLTDIKTGSKLFIKFLLKLSNKTSKTIIITTGTIETKLIAELKSSSVKLNNFIYEIQLNGAKAYLILDQNFFSISHIISKCKLFIACHGAFTHIAANYKIKILDVIESDKQIHYGRFTYEFKNYKRLFRENFNDLSNKIINCL
jgi:hypothetical protein